MTTLTKPYTVDELVTTIWESDLSHFEFMENMASGDCDCVLHVTLNTIGNVMGWTLTSD